jgi:hypothetical protein
MIKIEMSKVHEKMKGAKRNSTSIGPNLTSKHQK